jgi:hypothetical protein
MALLPKCVVKRTALHRENITRTFVFFRVSVCKFTKMSEKQGTCGQGATVGLVSTTAEIGVVATYDFTIFFLTIMVLSLIAYHISFIPYPYPLSLILIFIPYHYSLSLSLICLRRSGDKTYHYPDRARAAALLVILLLCPFVARTGF